MDAGQINKNDPRRDGPRPGKEGRNGSRASREKPGEMASTRSQELQPDRKTPAHTPVYETGNRAIIIFLTVCTKNRHRKLACDEIHSLLLNAWSLADRWVVGRYLIMPDHLHLFCAPGIWPPSPARKWVEYWKGAVARALKGRGPLVEGRGRGGTLGRGGTRPSKATEATAATPSVTYDQVRPGGTASTPSIKKKWPSPFWQRDCWDRQLRRGQSYSEKWAYVQNNPVRAGLCATPEEWPFQGCVTDLMWHD
ncbi:Transposase [Kiritimatiella glycovorans]|uniref:Transposase n=1 Tax=Kiritimatiella glycovorans TaxID=1307763 RepID=A0A0G3EB11_9BACT|nr:Transposase [Kiritimatiella glycovorans]